MCGIALSCKDRRTRNYEKDSDRKTNIFLRKSPHLEYSSNVNGSYTIDQPHEEKQKIINTLLQMWNTRKSYKRTIEERKRKESKRNI